jgi:hypothetical protein
VQRMVRLVVLEFALENAGTLEHIFVIVKREILELQVMAYGPGGHETETASSPASTADLAGDAAAVGGKSMQHKGFCAI